ncbi:MAG: hypothetical protein RLZZ347_450 [Candidatus Parcubacteria bacterium]|jgi:hypothetical protein
MKVALISPKQKDDYLLNDCIDGLFVLSQKRPDLIFRISADFIHPFPAEKINPVQLQEGDFVDFARQADMIVLVQRKGATNFELAEKIGMWHKTVFLDGSELGKDRRFDYAIQDAVLKGDYRENGGVDMQMLQSCVAYFRREKPYLPGITPFPYSIQSSYVKYVDQHKQKDIDFVCIFGQDQFPSMRRFVVKMLEQYCKENGFTFRTQKTSGFDFSLERKAGRDEFYEILSRAKVGISIGGGGFDTVRFWETLANNCLLITERIDIFKPESKELDYQRVYECNNLYDFKSQLERVGAFLKSGYDQSVLESEYLKILDQHSSCARVEKMITVSMEAIQKRQVQGKKCVVVVSSCDKYADLWEPFFTLFFRYWPDCPFPVHLISNTKVYNDPRVKTVLVGDDKGWATNIKTILSQYTEEYVLYLQEDYLLQSKVDTKKIESVLSYMASNDIAVTRLIGLPDPTHPHNNPFGLYEVKKGEPYRVSLQGSLWKRDIFLGLLKDGESGWEMEREGSVRSTFLNGTFLSARKAFPVVDYYYYTAIKKGKWMPGALRLLRREKIQVDPSQRGVHSRVKIFFGRVKNTLSRFRSRS